MVRLPRYAQAANSERAAAAAELQTTRYQLQEAHAQLAEATASHGATSELLQRQEAAADALQVGPSPTRSLLQPAEDVDGHCKRSSAPGHQQIQH